MVYVELRKQFWLGTLFGLFLALVPHLTSMKDSQVVMNAASSRNRSLVNKAADVTRRDRIFCWVVTTPKNRYKAEAVKQTWGRKCDRLLFMSSQNDTRLPAIGFPIGEESRDKLWTKAKHTLHYVYNHHLNDFEWFFKADDDTYAVMENLRDFLATFNPAEPLFLGHSFGEGQERFLSGGAGYVLTRESLRRVVEIGLNQNVCPTHYEEREDDVTITQCMMKIGVGIPNTSDGEGNHRFLSCDVEQFHSGQVGPVDCVHRDQRRNCISEKPITFHYVSGNKMLMYEYLLYRTQISSSPARDFILRP